MSNPDIALVVGLNLFISPTADSTKYYRSVVRGWDDKKRIWVDAVAGEEKFPLALMGRTAIFRFLQNGDACAFPARIDQVSGVDGTRASGLVIGWPNTFEKVGIRRHPRIHVQYPCKVQSDAITDMSGEIRDLSEGGCSIQLNDSASVEIGDELSISFLLPGALAMDNLKATVLAISKREAGCLLGCKFGELDEIAINNLRITISDSLAAMRGENVERIVVLGQNDSAVRSLVGNVRDAGFEVVVGEYILNAFYWLGGSPVHALIVVDHPLEISIDVLCQILRVTPSTESLPIYLIGDYDPLVRGKLSRLPLIEFHTFETQFDLLTQLGGRLAAN